MKILYHTLFDPSNLKAISNSFKNKKISEKLKFVFLLLNLSCCLLHNLNKLFIAFKAFKTEVYSVIKSFNAQSMHKTIFCYGPKTNNRLNARINRLFWFDNKSTIKNSFQPF